MEQGGGGLDHGPDGASRRMYPLYFSVQLAVTTECKWTTTFCSFQVLGRQRGNLLGNLISYQRRLLQSNEGVPGGPASRKR